MRRQGALFFPAAQFKIYMETSDLVVCIT